MNHRKPTPKFVYAKTDIYVIPIIYAFKNNFTKKVICL